MNLKVLAGVLERNIRRAVKAIITPNAVQSQLPFVGTVLDLVSTVSGMAKGSGGSTEKSQ